MKIGIDLDGVVFDTELFWATYAELYDCVELNKNSIIKKDEPRVQTKYNWSDDELKNFLNKYVDIKDFNIIPGAKEVIDLLKKDGHELIVITARGSFSDIGIKIAKEKLEDANIKFDKYFWGHKDKTEICKSENINIMIDDYYNICEDLSNQGIFSIYLHLLDRKHITEKSNLKEVSNWGEVYRIIKNLTIN